MKAVLLRETGGPEVLALQEVPDPVPGPGQVLVRIGAAAVSSGETRMRAGAYPLPALPLVFGAEAAGVVEQLGPGVDPAWLGARVTMVTGGFGSYAEMIAVPVSSIARIPAGVSTHDAVASAGPGALALALIARSRLQSGETALIEGGSGKVGGYLVRHAHELGARTIATASTAAGRERALARGADVVVDHSDPDWPARLEQIDVAYDMVGGAVPGKLTEKLVPSTGRLIIYGMQSGRQPELAATAILQSGLQVSGCAGPGWFADVLGIHYPEFLARAEQKRTYLLDIDAVLPLSQAAEAHRRIEEGASRIVLAPSGST
jgi:NADPH2:quinone reductase